MLKVWDTPKRPGLQILTDISSGLVCLPHCSHLSNQESPSTYKAKFWYDTLSSLKVCVSTATEPLPDWQARHQTSIVAAATSILWHHSNATHVALRRIQCRDHSTVNKWNHEAHPAFCVANIYSCNGDEIAPRHMELTILLTNHLTTVHLASSLWYQITLVGIQNEGWGNWTGRRPSSTLKMETQNNAFRTEPTAWLFIITIWSPLVCVRALVQFKHQSPEMSPVVTFHKRAKWSKPF